MLLERGDGGIGPHFAAIGRHEPDSAGGQSQPTCYRSLGAFERRVGTQLPEAGRILDSLHVSIVLYCGHCWEGRHCSQGRDLHLTPVVAGFGGGPW